MDSIFVLAIYSFFFKTATCLQQLGRMFVEFAGVCNSYVAAPALPATQLVL